MCTMVSENTEVTGSAKGPSGWFKVTEAKVSFEHPFNLQSEYSLNLDFVNDTLGVNACVAIELSPISARHLMDAIKEALRQGEEVIGPEAVVALK